MVRLTDYVTSGGCACKIGPHILNRVLKAVTPVTNKHVLADMTGADDAGVYQISDTFALVQTLDFFTPVVNDPDLFGKIAAANALSDVYAMGGTPLTAMNIVGFPVPLVEQGVLTDVLNGAGSIVAEAGAAIVGGHSIENKVAAEVAHNFTVHACTDVTGFSLMGHSVEMASASDVTIHIKAYDIPLFDDVIEAAQMGLIPAASYGNRKAITEVQVDEDLDPVWTDIVFDPQTSGGLLFSVPASESETLVEAFYKAGIDCAAIVGTVESFSGLAVRVTK
ncbi:MAG: selenide, water dikinase SelD [Veillonella sp.]|nr:selenide, water dikinase SelD [Veillonella sp.]